MTRAAWACPVLTELTPQQCELAASAGLLRRVAQHGDRMTYELTPEGRALLRVELEKKEPRC